jgi:hypothetical protein
MAIIAAMNLDAQKSTGGYIYGIPLLFNAHEQTHTPLLSPLLCIPVPVVWVHRLAERADLRNSILFETQHRVVGDQVFGERNYATARCLCTAIICKTSTCD